MPGQGYPPGYFRPATTSHATPTVQVYGDTPSTAYPISHAKSSGGMCGGPGVADRMVYPMMAPHDGRMHFHLPYPTSSAHGGLPHRRYNASLVNDLPTNEQYRYSSESQPSSLASYQKSAMPSQLSSFSPHKFLDQPDRVQVHAPLRAANSVASTKSEESANVYTPSMKSEEALSDGLGLLRDVPQMERRLVLPGIQAETQNMQHLVVEQSGFARPNTGQNDTQHPPVHGPAMEKPDPRLYGAAMPKPQLSKFKQQEENRGGSPSSLSQISTVSDLKEEYEDNFDHGVEKDVEMADKYAFNFACEAYKHRVPQKYTKGITIHVGSLAARTTTLKDHRMKAESKTSAVDEEVVPPLLPHANELQKRNKSIECVWIGMLPSPVALLQIMSEASQPGEDADSTKGSRKLAKKQVQRGATVSGVREDDITFINFDQNALRVVARKWDKITKDTHIYALLNPRKDSQHCQGFKVSFDEVFFFRHFRDDTAKSIQSRKQATKAMIRACLSPVMTLGRLQSPTPTSGESESLSLAVLPTPSPLPATDASRRASIAYQLCSPSAVCVAYNTPTASKGLLTQTARGEENVKFGKRKAQHSIIEATLKHRDQARKKAKAEGYSVPQDDSELRNSVHTSDRDTKFNCTDDSFGNDPMISASDYLADVDEALEPINQGGKVVKSSPERESYGGDDEDYDTQFAQRESVSLSKKMKELVDDLAIGQDAAGLQQALTLVQCIRNRRGPPKTSALGLYFNVPSTNDIEDCAMQLKQLRVRIHL